MYSMPGGPNAPPPAHNLITRPVNKGVEICVEALNEWKIKEIGYDGVEKYAEPMRFRELLTENAHLVNWRRLVGSDATLDVSGSGVVKEETSEEGEEIEQEKREERSEKPTAGPWAAVARNLQ